MCIIIISIFIYTEVSSAYNSIPVTTISYKKYRLHKKHYNTIYDRGKKLGVPALEVWLKH